MMYAAADTALVECVDGKPYSSLADPDILIRCSGGESGLGKQTKSFTQPLKKTPRASICTNLVRSGYFSGFVNIKRA